MIVAAIAAPIAAALLSSTIASGPARRFARIASAIVAAALGIAAAAQLDRLSAVFVLLVSILSPLATAFSTSIFPERSDGADDRWASRPAYFVLLGAFWSSMLLAVSSQTFIGLWIGISATTLATTFLVGYSGSKTALEAAWKYLILCSFGIAIALVGMLLLGRAAMQVGIAPSQALAWSQLALHAAAMPPALLRLALLLVLVGFATKAGLVPMHAWLPDAHSKAPAPVSALLSGLLVSCAVYALMRVQYVSSGVPAGAIVNGCLLALGTASVLIGSTLMLAQRDVKRFLSYSTVEHAGLIAIALGCATPLGAFAALYHVLAHAFSKSLAFLAVGVIQRERETTQIAELHGLWRASKGGKFFLLGLAGLAGLPPFGMLVSELLVVTACAMAKQWVPLACALLGMLVAFAALTRLAIEAASGAAPDEPPRARVPRIALVAAAACVAGGLVLAVLPFVAWGDVLYGIAVALKAG